MTVANRLNFRFLHKEYIYRKFSKMIKKVSKCHTEGFCQQNMAIIMTVYQDFDFVINNIRKLHEGFDVFIHIDKKANVPNCFLMKPYN